MQVVAMNQNHLPEVLAIECRTQLNPWHQGEFENSLNRQSRVAWVALDETAVIGYCVFSLAADEAELLTISIHPRFQGRGLGKHLLLDCLSKLAFDSLFLEVRQSNSAAIALYESVGFNEVGSRKNYYPNHQGRPNQQGREDALIYALTHAEVN